VATLLKSVNTLVAQGYTIAEGHIISNGALGQIVRLEPGTYHADFSALGEVAITVR
jgi:2-keto-4-pentenoate hydratase